MKSVKFDNDSYTLPEKWSELSDDEILFLAKLHLKNKEFVKFKTIYCLYLLGLRLKFSTPVMLKGELLYYVKHSRTRVYLLSAEQIHALNSAIDWLFTSENVDNVRKVLVNSKLVRNPVKNICVRFKKYRGPDDGLGNITYSEFMHAETFLHRFDTNNDSKWLAMFLATLWRPVKNGTVEPFNQDKLERRAKMLSKVKPHIILAIRWYYSGCKAFLAKEFPLTFSPSVSTAKPSDPFKGYLDLANTLSSSDATKVESLLNTNIYFALRALEDMISKAEKTQQ